MNNKASEVSHFELDDMDLQLAKELEINARQTHPELAAKMGVSSSTVRRRLKRLLDSRAVSITSITNPAAVNFQALALFGIHIRPGESDEVMRLLAECPCVQYSGLYVGRYDVLMVAAFRDQRGLVDFIDTELATVPHILGFDLMSVLKTVKTSWRYLGGSRFVPTESQPRQLDEAELMLIKEIESNPLESIKNLSARLGVNRASLSRRLQTLLSDDVIKVVGIISQQAFGLHALVAILVDVVPGELGAVADKLAGCQKVHHLVIVTGEFSILLWAVFADSDELYTFLRDDVGRAAGVVRHETMLQLAIPKFAFKLTPSL